MACCPYDTTMEIDVNKNLENIISITLGEEPIEGTTDDLITLSANVSTTQDLALEFNWHILEGDSVIFSTPNELTTQLSDLTSGTYVIGFTATDIHGNSQTATLSLNIIPVEPLKQLDVSLGDDITLALPFEYITLTAIITNTQSSTLSYSWTHLSELPLVFSSSNSPSTQISGLSSGTYVIQFSVEQNGISATDSLTLTIIPPANQLPTIILEEEFTLTLPTNTISITATATYNDGTVTHYYWQVTDAQNETITTSSNTILILENLSVGTYSVQFTATDNNGASSMAYTQITVHPAPNLPPQIQPIQNIEIQLPQRQITLTTEIIDEDPLEQVLWEVVNTNGEQVLNVQDKILDISALPHGIYMATLIVTDQDAAVSSTTFSITLFAPDDRKILWQWYQEGLTTNRVNLNWAEKNANNAPLEEWTGVRAINAEGRLVQLELIQTYLGGVIIPELWKLTELEHLSLRKNNFNHIPLEFFDLVNLKVLSFSENNISILPEEIGKLSQLKELFFSNNALTNSSLPTQLWELKTLERLSFLGNQLTFLPEEIGELTQLKWLEMYRNKLEGTVPESYNNLTALKLLRLYDNPNLKGKLPANLCLVEQLEILNTGLYCE